MERENHPTWRGTLAKLVESSMPLLTLELAANFTSAMRGGVDVEVTPARGDVRCIRGANGGCAGEMSLK